MKYIAIHSVPRSGSSWLGAIFNSHPDIAYRFQPLFSYAFRGFMDEHSSTEKINTFFKELKETKDEFILQKTTISEAKMPAFKKAKNPQAICYKEVRYHYILPNLLAKEPTIKIILLVRNPLATLYSWKKAPREFKKHLGWIFKDEWLAAPSKNENKKEEYNGYLKWKEATSLFLTLEKQYPNNVKIVRYGDLLNDPLAVTKQLFSFCNLTISESTQNFIQASVSKNNEDSYGVFKIKPKKDELWKDLDDAIINYITEDLKNTPLEKFLND